jgi:hypothetical protein
MMLYAQYDVCLAPRSPPVAKSGITRDLYAIAFVLVFSDRRAGGDIYPAGGVRLRAGL